MKFFKNRRTPEDEKWFFFLAYGGGGKKSPGKKKIIIKGLESWKNAPRPLFLKGPARTHKKNMGPKNNM